MGSPADSAGVPIVEGIPPQEPTVAELMFTVADMQARLSKFEGDKPKEAPGKPLEAGWPGSEDSDDGSEAGSEHGKTAARRRKRRGKRASDPPPDPEFSDDSSSEESDDYAKGSRGEKDIGKLFGGYELPIPFEVENPFQRSVPLRGRTSHYKPSTAGDTIHAEVYDSLGAANKREMCTLIPTLSYLHDLSAFLTEFVGDIQEERAKPRGERVSTSDLLRDAERRSAAALLQVESILGHCKERGD